MSVTGMHVCVCVRAHLLERGISPVTTMDFQLGYSPADFKSPLIEYLTQARIKKCEGFELATLVDAGLVADTSKWRAKTGASQRYTANHLDRFRGRLVVPICDHRGKVIGFGARDLPGPEHGKGKKNLADIGPELAVVGPEVDSEGTDPVAATPVEVVASTGAGGGGGVDTPVSGEGEGAGVLNKKSNRPRAKYLNSPETSLFKKSKTVFGLDLAKQAIRKEDMAVVVEGYFDVIKLHEGGIRYAVGVLGTAVTADQLQMVARYCQNKRVVLCLDADEAGQQAVARLCESPSSSGLDALSEAGVVLSVASIPAESGCKDPADFLQAHGAGAFREEVLGRSKPWTEWFGDRILSEHDHANDANAFRLCVERVTSLISELSLAADKTFQIYKFAEALAGENPSKRVSLEIDLRQMADEKHALKKALQRRTGRGGWVVDSVKRKKAEEARLRWEKKGRFNVWSPVPEQSMSGQAEVAVRELARQRERILDQSQRLLLSLAVHCPELRGRCREALSSHGLYLGCPERQWLLEAVLPPPPPACAGVRGIGGPLRPGRGGGRNNCC
ncbi:unnamed protein product [Discosporangium mesarthrocarpum]